MIPETSGALTMIRLPYINPEIFRQFLRYVYTGKVGKVTLKEILQVMFKSACDFRLSFRIRKFLRL